ncbi:hypothetical protein [Lacticaseibacillus absianus]|uniref:hypothetical protein n=1 Tax=Lacticaseibacillus absianus TaxID=2729623 RepID=UPI0015C90B26|nr:hypothetical protein [Lacticaseibacillus absianus]
MKGLFRYDNPVMRALATGVDVFVLNVLFILTSLPLITLLGNMIALRISVRQLRAHEGHLYRRYLMACRQNFVLGLKMLGVFLPVLIIGYFSFVWSFNITGLLSLYSKFSVLLGMTVWSVIVNEMVDYCSRYQSPFKQSLYNAYKIGVFNIRPVVAGIIVFLVLIQVFNPAGLVTLIYLGSFGGFASLAWLFEIWLAPVYEKYTA